MHLWCVVPGNKSWKVIFIKFFVWKHKRAWRLLSLEALPASQLCKSRGRCCWRFPGPAPAFGGVSFFVRWLHVPLWLRMALRRLESSMSLVLTASWPMSLGVLLREDGVAALVQWVYPARANELPPDRNQI